MVKLQKEDIINFLKKNIEPLDDYGDDLGYRAAVYLLDGTFLPCVLFRNSEKITANTLARVKEAMTRKSIFSRRQESNLDEILKSLTVFKNRLRYADIAKIERSQYAFPPSINKQIKGETSMLWTAFVARFYDGRCLSFATSWGNEFFDMPQGYFVDDIKEIINHSYVTKNGEIVEHHSFDRISRGNELEKIYRERPFFECFVDGL